MTPKGRGWFMCLAVLTSGALSAADTGVSRQGPPPTPHEFKVKREAVFEFAQKPVVTRNGDNIAIAFESKGLCDATVAIEDAQGRIIRHLASGVLGPKAPAPFQKDSKKHTVVWDGKNDQDVYVDDKDSHTVRVSLGLKPQFERSLNWCPQRNVSEGGVPLLRATPDGVYVHDGCGVDQVRLFDHGGNYARTVYPFPGAKLRMSRGLTGQPFPRTTPGCRSGLADW